MKTISIEQLAERLGETVWIKGELKRIYLNDAGWNTKKMSTKTFIWQDKNGNLKVSCKINCPSQGDNWISSQEDEVINSIQSQIDSIIEEFGVEVEKPVIEEVEDPNDIEVKGYYLAWREARIKINAYGKLATRNRQFIVVYQGKKSKAPKGFVELSDEAFEFAKRRNDTHIEPYTTLDFEAMVAAFAESKKLELAMSEAIREEKEAKEALIKESNAKIAEIAANGGDVLEAWVIAGCPQPAPAQVAQAKIDSGIGWRPFTESLKAKYLAKQ